MPKKMGRPKNSETAVEIVLAEVNKQLEEAVEDKRSCALAIDEAERKANESRLRIDRLTQLKKLLTDL